MEELSNGNDQYRQKYDQLLDGMIATHLERVNIKNNNFRRKK
jgi:hypothetical protein